MPFLISALSFITLGLILVLGGSALLALIDVICFVLKLLVFPQLTFPLPLLIGHSFSALALYVLAILLSSFFMALLLDRHLHVVQTLILSIYMFNFIPLKYFCNACICNKSNNIQL